MITTRMMPSVRLCSTVCVVKCTRSLRSMNGNDLHARGQDVVVQLLHFFVESLQRRVRIGAFPQERDARDHIVVVDDLSVLVANRPRELAEPDLRALRDDGDILHAQRRAALGHEDGVFDIVHVPDQAHFPDVDLLQAGFDEAAAGIDVVVGELLLHLGEAEPVGDQLVRDRREPDIRAWGRRSWPHRRYRERP